MRIITRESGAGSVYLVVQPRPGLGQERGLADKVRAAAIYKKQRFSDHAPLIIDYDYAI